MRLLSPKVLLTVANIAKDEDFSKATVSRKQVVSHAWSECLKYLATRQPHPKMFLDDEMLGVYMRYIYTVNTNVGCNLNSNLIDDRYPIVRMGFDDPDYELLFKMFDELYLFSDCVSLYFKGLNILPYIYGDDWRRLVPIENLKEVPRVVGKTIGKGDVK
jgi:hypothetical protein